MARRTNARDAAGKYRSIAGLKTKKSISSTS